MDTCLAKVDVRICRASEILSARKFEPGLMSGFICAWPSDCLGPRVAVQSAEQKRHMNTTNLSRRGLIKAAATGFAVATTAATARAQLPRKAATKDYKIKNKRIQQSIMGWTFNPMPTEELIAACTDIGLTGIEGIGRQFYPAARKAGLEISLVGSHGFAKGPNDPNNHKMVVERLIDGISGQGRWSQARDHLRRHGGSEH